MLKSLGHKLQPGRQKIRLEFKPSWKKADANRGTTTQRGYGWRWQKERVPFLQSNPYCRPCLLQGKRTPAGIVDHIVPHKGNPALMWDQSNWQPICSYCHIVKTVNEDGGLNSGAATHPEWLPVPACRVTLVTGPAGAGKSTWCKRHASAYDVIIDLDECFTAVCGVHGHHAEQQYLGKALRLRNKLLASLASKRNGRAFVIVSAPTVGEINWWIEKLNADHMRLDPGLDVCLGRLDPSRREIARKWYAKQASNKWIDRSNRLKVAR